MDKAGRTYWDAHWGEITAEPFTPDRPGLRYYRDRVLAKLIDKATRGLPCDSNVLEAGCADSTLLPYIASLGFRISGVDYSEIGCNKFRARIGSIPADIECCDIFRPPARLMGSADLVMSYGLVEHFSNTAECVAAIAAFAKPTGRVLTIIPNMCGTLGALQRLVGPSIYNVHVPLTREDLVDAHRAAGLEVTSAGYLLPVGYGVLDYREPGVSGAALLARRVLVAALARLSWVGWFFDQLIALPATRFFAPYSFCIAAPKRRT